MFNVSYLFSFSSNFDFYSIILQCSSLILLFKLSIWILYLSISESIYIMSPFFFSSFDIRESISFVFSPSSWTYFDFGTSRFSSKLLMCFSREFIWAIYLSRSCLFFYLKESKFWSCSFYKSSSLFSISSVKFVISFSFCLI